MDKKTKDLIDAVHAALAKDSTDETAGSVLYFTRAEKLSKIAKDFPEYTMLSTWADVAKRYYEEMSRDEHGHASKIDDLLSRIDDIRRDIESGKISYHGQSEDLKKK